MSRNLRCDLKEDIREAVSELRTSFSNLWNVMEEKERLINSLTEAAKKAETAGAVVSRNGDSNERNRRSTPSVDGGLNFSAADTSSKHRSVRCGETSVGGRSNYGTAVRDSSTTHKKNYKLMIKSKHNESREAMKTLLKRKINPSQLKVGISSMKALRDGRLVIESGKKEDIDVLSKHIEDQCSQFLEVNSAILA
ncbi:hypothetical protein C0J52_22647 [Blattella germanica]|nr:hypothetical protein C0J52_22647 [Blattella germanica]